MITATLCEENLAIDLDDTVAIAGRGDLDHRRRMAALYRLVAIIEEVTVAGDAAPEEWVVVVAMNAYRVRIELGERTDSEWNRAVDVLSIAKAKFEGSWKP